MGCPRVVVGSEIGAGTVGISWRSGKAGPQKGVRRRRTAENCGSPAALRDLTALPRALAASTGTRLEIEKGSHATDCSGLTGSRDGSVPRGSARARCELRATPEGAVLRALVRGDSARQGPARFVEVERRRAQDRRALRDDEFICGYTLSVVTALLSLRRGQQQPAHLRRLGQPTKSRRGTGEALAQRVLAAQRARSARGVTGVESPGRAARPRARWRGSRRTRGLGTVHPPTGAAARSGGVHEAGGSSRPSGTHPRPPGLPPPAEAPDGNTPVTAAFAFDVVRLL